MSVLRDVALVILALEGVVLTLAALAMLAAINYGLLRFRWWHTVPRWLAVVWGYLALAQRIVERVCRAVVSPILAVARAWAALSGVVRGD
ncbi:MAG TPA: hypothetical protein ENI37_02140 [Chloroflexi bacterium]|nr:hypothetical protein [Chloroflexota bacterium]